MIIVIDTMEQIQNPMKHLPSWCYWYIKERVIGTMPATKFQTLNGLVGV